MVVRFGTNAEMASRNLEKYVKTTLYFLIIKEMFYTFYLNVLKIFTVSICFLFSCVIIFIVFLLY